MQWLSGKIGICTLSGVAAFFVPGTLDGTVIGMEAGKFRFPRLLSPVSLTNVKF